MNAQNARQYMPLVQALANGLTIQFNDGGDWVDVDNLNTDSYDPDEYRIKPKPRTFEMWLSPSSGAMFPFATFPNDQHDMERITVKEVLK